MQTDESERRDVAIIAENIGLISSRRLQCREALQHAYQGLICLEQARLKMDFNDVKQVTTMNVGNIKRAAWQAKLKTRFRSC